MSLSAPANMQGEVWLSFVDLAQVTVAESGNILFSGGIFSGGVDGVAYQGIQRNAAGREYLVLVLLPVPTAFQLRKISGSGNKQAPVIQ